MQTDFLDAHQRHIQDAEILQEYGRLANADHLYGLSAECGLKGLMQAFGMHIDPKSGKPTERADLKHIDELLPRYERYRAGRIGGGKFALPSDSFFEDWHVSQRYAHRSGFKKEIVQKHASGAKAIAGLVRQAKMEGLI